jgi:diacylglycerol kinase (ATP)
MLSPKKQIVQAHAALRDLEKKHKRIVRKIDRGRRKVDKREVRLLKVEAELARLERRIVLLRQSTDGDGAAAIPPLRRAFLVFNPTSGSGGKDSQSPRALIEALRVHGIEAEVGLKTSGKVARQLTRQAVKNKYDLVIVGGGDGTIEDVASQLEGTETALGILPVGTRNNLARELGIPLDLDQACDLLAAGITRKIDVGRVRTNDRKDADYFLESAGLGVSAVVLPAGQALSKGRLWKISSALRKLFELKPGPVELELDTGEKIQANTQLVTVSNAPLIGLNMLVAPEAKMDDGLLDVAVYADMTKTDLTSYFLATTEGRRAYNPNVRFWRACRVVIRCDEDLPAVADKDAVKEGQEPGKERKAKPSQELEIDVMPAAINAVVGNGVALTLPVEAVASVPPLAGKQPGVPNPDEQLHAPSPKPAAEPVPA